MNCAITLSGKFNYDGGIVIPEHYHSATYQIQFLISGNVECVINNEPLPLKPKEVLFIKQGMTHSYTVDKETGASSLEIEFNALDPDTVALLSTIRTITPDRDGILESLLRRIVREGQKKGLRFTEMANALLTACVICLARLSTSPEDMEQVEKVADDPSSSKVLLAATNYIYQNLNKSITIADLAKGCGYNKDYLYRTIKREKGISAIQYINNIRYEEACKMIAVTDLSISEISWKLGFDSIQYFSRFFKTRAGVSPSEYLKRTRGVIRTDY